MPSRQLARSPFVTYIWMVISVLFVLVLFERWAPLERAGRQWRWWAVLAVFLAADFLFLLIPIRDRNSIRYLSRPGKLWAASAWLLVLVFLQIIVPQSGQNLRQQHPLAVTGAGLGSLVLLVLAIVKLTRSWVRQSLRTIVARTGGGFLVSFPQSAVGRASAGSESEQILLALAGVPGAQPESAASAWRVPAEAGAAAALLELAKRFDFDFVPRPRPGK